MMKKITQRTKRIPITKKEAVIRAFIVSVVLWITYITKEEDRGIINVIALLMAFFGTLYLHKHFFPLFTLTIVCYLTAACQELWSPQYIHLKITDYLWTAGNLLMPLAVFDFMYQIIFKYKIVENGQKD